MVSIIQQKKKKKHKLSNSFDCHVSNFFVQAGAPSLHLCLLPFPSGLICSSCEEKKRVYSPVNGAHQETTKVVMMILQYN